jgi:glutaminyl-peptide cyclotransferase
VRRFRARSRRGFAAGLSWALLAFASPTAGASPAGQEPPAPPPATRSVAQAPEIEQLVAHVIDVRPHDPGAFTQGWLIQDGRLFESTGRDRGDARLRELELLDGGVQREFVLPPDESGGYYWGEGLAAVGDRLVQLTWRHGVAFVYERDTFLEVGRHEYQGEGWGLSYDGRRLVMSDGSSRLTFRDPATFEVQGGVDVTADGVPVTRLNELECVGASVYANVFLTDTIVRIDAATGLVTAWIDAANLLAPEEEAGADVLNGIAYDERRDTFLITGKWWPKAFEVRFVPRPAATLYVPLAVVGRS